MDMVAAFSVVPAAVCRWKRSLPAAPAGWLEKIWCCGTAGG